ncbi:E3 ubiquitin-protein ligase [Melia azedarach]|uniref:E3 ubiquitin-protein ligase n=1 Tax=Melia azedarach TaxID=155640 RepID=A0ACC1X6A0_MELAZ|nr:E3 ubiquitin-protein ligase [Melia azedarach]
MVKPSGLDKHKGGDGSSSRSSSKRRRRVTEPRPLPEPNSTEELSEGGGANYESNSVTLTDPDALDCPICYEHLFIPVFQCENGHIACSKCCSKLADRCPSCCLPVGFRNRAIEKILESSKVLCQNAKYGCREIMIFNDRHNHETKCGYAPCSCPLSSCEFIDSSSQLYQHFSDKHKQSAVQFLYNSFFQIKLNVQDKYLILQEKKEGTLFVLNNSKNADHSANIISIDCIAPKGIDLLMDYDIIARHLSGHKVILHSLNILNLVKNIYADFPTKFRPVTVERPQVLLPLVNAPMTNYTLAWLEQEGVAEIRGDFVLISGDIVSNMSLTQVLQEHKERKKKDYKAVMTMIIKKSKPFPITHQSRLGTDELFMAIDPITKQLLYFEDKENHLKRTICLDKMLLAENPSMSLYYDKLVVIGEHFVESAYSKVSLFQQPAALDSDEELEYADNSDRTIELSLDKCNGEMTSDSSEDHKTEFGTGGVGYIYGRHEEEWRHSVAPIPADRRAEITHAIDDDQEFVTQDGTALSASGELMSDTNTNASEGDIREDSKDDFLYFEKEVNYRFN